MLRHAAAVLSAIHADTFSCLNGNRFAKPSNFKLLPTKDSGRAATTQLAYPDFSIGFIPSTNVITVPRVNVPNDWNFVVLNLILWHGDAG